MAWEHGTTGEGYDVGTHLMGMDLSGHALVGADAWRPSLCGDILVYWDGSLKVTDLAGGGTHDLDPSGDFATAGPTFAAYYRPGGAGSLVVVRGYGGAHEQSLGRAGDATVLVPAHLGLGAPRSLRRRHGGAPLRVADALEVRRGPGATEL